MKIIIALCFLIFNYSIYADVLPEAKSEVKITLARKPTTRPMTVAFIPGQKKYYIADGGLAPLGSETEAPISKSLIHTYDQSGKYVASTQAGFDNRSIFYNELSFQLTTITYNVSSEAGFAPNTGIFSLDLDSQGILKGGFLSIHCIDNVINNVEGLTFINITSNSAMLIWNSPINLYDYNLNDIPDITYNIYQYKNNEWILLKKNYKNKFYNINNINTTSIRIKISTNNNECGLIIELKLPSNNKQYKISYMYDNIVSEKLWLINGNLNGEFNDVKNDFEPIFK